MGIINNLLKKLYLQIYESVLTFCQIGNKLPLILLLVVFNLKSYGQYVPPAGIPAPPFGIDEVAPAWPSAWPDTEVENFYYVDNTHPNSSTSNTYGTPNAPRTTFPEGVHPAGTYIELHGGPYTGGGQIIITGNGTASNPVWIRGESPTVRAGITKEMLVRGSYVIVENLVFSVDAAKIGLRQSGSGGFNIDHISIRNCEMYGSGNWAGTTSCVGIGGYPENRFTDIVIYKNYFHDRGDLSPTVDQNDYTGVTTGPNTDRIWILDNDFSRLAGDAVLVGKAVIADDSQRPSYIYMGGNDFYDNRENAIDIKESDHVFVIDNDCHGFEITTSSTGEAVVLHDGTENVWVVNNRIYDAEYGIITTKSTNTWFIGNTIWNIHTTDLSSWNPNSAWARGAAIHFRGSSNGWVLNNTIYNYDMGIEYATGGPYESFNNILFGRAQPTGYDLALENSNVRNQVTSDYNMYESASLNFGTSSGTDVAGAQSSYSKEMNSLSENPNVADAGGNDFTLLSSSKARDAGVLHAAYALFESTYGLSIAEGMNGISRPQDGKWDMGALEYGSTLSNNDETLDTTISIFPNPTNDILTIDLDDDIVKKIIIYNELGQHIKEATTKEVNISNLSNGIYFFKIILQNGKTATKKIIKN